MILKFYLIEWGLVMQELMACLDADECLLVLEDNQKGRGMTADISYRLEPHDHAVCIFILNFFLMIYEIETLGFFIFLESPHLLASF